MGKMLVSIMNGHVTGTPTFFVDPSGDAKKHQLTINVTVNGPKKKDGTRDADTIPCKIWGKYGAIAAHQLDNGSGVNIIGELKTWKRDTGKVNAAGKKEFDEKITIRVDNFFHTGATGKEGVALVTRNIAAFENAKALGQVHPAAICTPEIMLKKPEPVVVPDFNLLVAAQTGRYGFAKVWTKDRGFIGPQNAAAINAAAEAPMVSPNIALDLAELTKMVKILAASQAANAALAVAVPAEIVPAGSAQAAGAVGVDGFEGA
jgi:single-stranded DNA-binding protein